jgi:hypothetical protein
MDEAIHWAVWLGVLLWVGFCVVMCVLLLGGSAQSAVGWLRQQRTDREELAERRRADKREEFMRRQEERWRLEAGEEPGD